VSERSGILVGVLVLVGGIMFVSTTSEQWVRFIAAAEIVAAVIIITVSARKLKIASRVSKSDD